MIRHFNVIYIPEPDPVTLTTIISKVCEYGFEDFVDKVKLTSKVFPSLCLKLYQEVASTFLPLPKKSHYLFNLRDLMKVLQGILSVKKYEAVDDVRTKLIRLWIHENRRVYEDRLVDEEDKNKLNDIIHKILDEESIELPQLDNLYYGNWAESHSILK